MVDSLRRRNDYEIIRIQFPLLKPPPPIALANSSGILNNRARQATANWDHETALPGPLKPLLQNN